MITLFKMAFRDLGRNRRRSFFSALALGMGLALLLLMSSMIAGEIRGALNTSIKLQSGHLQVRMKGYEEEKTSLKWEDLIEAPGQVAAKIAALAPIQVATPRLYASGMVAKGKDTLGVRIVGIDPQSEANAPYREGLLSGEFLQADDREGVVIGQPLAKKLDLQAGDQIDLLVNTSSGDVAEQLFTVRGIYSTRTPGYDEVNVFMPLDKAQAISQATNHASIIFILLKDREQTPAVAQALQSSQFEVKDWVGLNEMLTSTEEMANAFMIVLYLIVLGITATVIVNTLVMAVFERTREIGILSAIGMKSWRIMSMFFAESSILAVGGILIGLLLGAGLMVYAQNVGFLIGDFGTNGILLGERIYGYAQAKDVIELTIIAFVVTLAASLYPALLAARMEPVEALHGGK